MMTRRVDPALVRGLTSPRLSRRGMLAGLGGAGLAAALSGCSIEGTRGSGDGGGTDWTEWWASKKKHGSMTFANWPLYIDQDDSGKSESVAKFTKATGIKVSYKEVIQGNDSFYAKIAPLLKAKQSTGYDIIVITNGWYLTELINNGWLAQLDHTAMPNFYEYGSRSVLNPAYDPSALHTAVWQTGFTGLAYTSKYVKEPITSFTDLLRPELKGKIGMMTDLSELGSAGLLALGIDPVKSTHADWSKARAWLEKVQPSVAKYYDQGYTDALQNGDIWVSQAWSGDIYQLQSGGHKEIKFVTPKEGQMVWHDNMCIPITAANPVDALAWMNYYYQPEPAGLVEDYVNYVCPVPAAKAYIRDVLKDPKVANSPLIFPTAAMEAKSKEFYVYTDYDDYQAWTKTFSPLVQS